MRTLPFRSGNELAPVSIAESRERRVVYAIAALLLGLLAWAALAPVDRIVRAEGRIIAAAKSQIVQHLEGGIVQEIAVREGQGVEAGQLLMRLSDIQANANMQQGVTRLEMLQALQARLVAEADGAGTVQFPAGVDPRQQTLELDAFRERGRRMDSEQSALRQQIAQRQAELREAQSRAQNIAGELELARRQAGLVEGLRRKGAASEMELLDAQARVQRLVGNYTDVITSVPRLTAAIGEINSRLSESTARFRAEARAELAQTNAEIRKLSLAVGGDADRVARTEVRAPVSGFVNRLHFNTIGGVVRPGEALLEITPSEGPLAIDARVRPDDRAALRPGLPTRVMIGAYDFSVYGALDGRVVEVSADTLQDERGARYYRVLIETEQAQGPLAGALLLPGMTARADVVAGQRSVLSYLLSPLLKFSAQALREAR